MATKTRLTPLQRIKAADGKTLADDLVSANLDKYIGGLKRCLDSLPELTTTQPIIQLPPEALQYGAILLHSLVGARALAHEVCGLMEDYEKKQILLTHQNTTLSPAQQALLTLAEIIDADCRSSYPGNLARKQPKTTLFAVYAPSDYHEFLNQIDTAYSADVKRRLDAHRRRRINTPCATAKNPL